MTTFTYIILGDYFQNPNKVNAITLILTSELNLG